MCRMIAFVGSGPASLEKVFKAFREGSRCDPYVQAAFGAEFTCHPHGWGSAVYDGAALHHFRSALPVWKDEFRLPAVNGKPVCALFHSRLASNPALNAPICSHPFIASTDKEVLLLAHNGGVEMDESASSLLVDSEWALGVVVQAGSLEKALPQLKERTRQNSALNLMVLAIPRDQTASPAVLCLNFYKTQDPARAAYYKMYTADLDGGKLFLSSTFRDLEIEGLTGVKEAPFGQLFRLQCAA